MAYRNNSIITIYKKRDPEGSLVLFCEYGSHEVCNTYSSVVLVAVCSECLSIWCAIRLNDEWVSNHTVTGLEANFWLEGVRINAAEHLEGNIWAVE